MNDRSVQPIDVVISLVNTSNRELTRACLTSIPEACSGITWKAVVVDNASSDGSAEMVAEAFPWAALIRNATRMGFGHNHNLVIRSLLDNRGARYVLVLNEDTELEPGSVAKLVEFADRRRLGSAGPSIYGLDGRRQFSFFRFPTLSGQLYSTLTGDRFPRPPLDQGWLNASCVLLSVEALEQVGIFDEDFFIFFEDSDIGYRLDRAGWKAGVDEESRILHKGHHTVSQPALGSAMERQMLRSQYLYFRKHHGSVRASLLAGLVRANYVARALASLFEAAVLRQSGAGAKARLLFALARYDPAQVLPHELRSRSALVEATPGSGPLV